MDQIERHCGELFCRITVSQNNGNESIGKIDAKAVNLHGNLLITGTAGSVALGNIVGPSTFTISTPVSAKDMLTVTLGRITDLSISSGTPIKSLTAIDWQDNNGTSDTTNTPWIDTLTLSGSKTETAMGDFEADLTLSGTGAPKGLALNKVTVVGNIQGSEWSLATGGIGTISAGATASTWHVNAPSGGVNWSTQSCVLVR